MQYVAETGVVKLYDGDKLVGESRGCFSKEIKPITITPHDINIAMEMTTHYDVKQDPEDGKWYWFANGVKVCEIFPKNNP